MSAPSIPFNLAPKQQEAVVKYVQDCVQSLSSMWNIREQLLLRDLVYNREVDRTVEQLAALRANRTGDIKKYQNLVVPIVMPQVESALAYQAGVFLTGYPIFGIASSPADINEALQMETVIADNSTYYGWPRQLIMFLRDGLKYNIGALEVQWKKKRIYSLINDPAKNMREGSKNETYYEGNHLRRLDPYNTIWDKRVAPSQVHCDGEFAGYTELMSRIQLKQLLLDLSPENTMNGRNAFESGNATVTLNQADSWYYIPQVNPLAFVGAQSYTSTNWVNWAMLEGNGKNGGDINYGNIYEVTTLYGKIIPNDFRMAVPQRNQPQIWKFIVVNRRILVYVERLTNAHNYLPIIFCQPIEDGLGYQTKSFADNAVPFQDMSTSLWASAIASRRRLVFDRIIYDSSRIRKEDIDKVTEVARIPVKQSAYGKPISEAVHQFPYNDAGVADTLSMAQSVYAMADEANGQNKVQRGQFQKGNKTKVEFQDTMGNANSRQQLQALGLEYGTFIPIKEIIKTNILQYQPGSTYYNAGEKKTVQVNPMDLRKKVLSFKVSDGMLPTDKLLSTDLLQVFMQTIQTSPLMQAEFDMVGAFVYWCKTQGAQWLDDFRRDDASKQQVLAQLSAFEAKSKAARPQNAADPSGAT